MYTVLKQLENGEFVNVASRNDLQEAMQLAQSLNAEWPGEYEVRDSYARVVRLPLTAAWQSNPQAPA